MLHTEATDADFSQCMYSTNTTYTDLTDLGEKRLIEMDRAGIDVAVLSSTRPVEDLDPDAAIQVAKLSNNDVYEATKKYPDRFMGSVLLPTLQIDAACAELERCVRELGFKYWHAQSNMTGPDGTVYHIWEPQFEPILAKAAELNVAIYLHPEYPTDADYWGFGVAYAGPGIGYGQDVMQTATHLVMNGTFDKYPNLRIILGHMGEYLPYILDRMNFHQNLYLAGAPNVDPENMKCKETLYRYVVTNANIVISTSGSADTNAFLCAKEALGPDRIVFASDWPYENFTNSTAFIDTCELSDAEKDGIWSDNAAMYILHETTPVSEDILSINHVTYSLWQRDTDKDEWREVKFNTVSNRYEVLSNAQAKIVYEAEPGYYFSDKSFYVERMLDTTVSPVTVVPGQGSLPEVIEGSRAPDYASDDGHDWLFNHAIPGKQYEGEAAADNGVDIFFIYPTLMTKVEPALQYENFRLIDDPEMREMTVAGWTDSVTSAFDAFWKNARCLGDLGYVYAPFYRQATNPHMIEQGTYANLTNMIYHGYGYMDITNALETYFTKWNTNADGSRRKFILAAHSQGSATLMLAMEHYFTQDPAHKNLLTNLVASYQIGMGVDKQWIADLEANTKTAGFDGVTFASDATGTCVVVSYNTTGETTGEPCASILLPAHPVSINPISWTTDDTLADKTLNLGSLTNIVPERIVNGLHSAKVNLARGTVESCGFTDADWTEPTHIFGEASVHGWDYRAFWEDLHKNAYDRITAATGKEPIVGHPTDYADPDNWMRLGDAEKTGATDKPFDIFYLYPMSAYSEVDYVGAIDDGMKRVAASHYAMSLPSLEPYANVYAPYYRQLSTCAMSVYPPTADGAQLNFARHVGKTDTFAALDYYFENVNPDGMRPFVLTGHSQGSASLKNILEQYFVGEKKALLKNMIACYAIGWTFSTDWCQKYGYTFATGASDTNVVITWNAEALDAPPLQYLLTSDPHGQAINPLNWKRDDTYAPITENLGSFKDGALVPGGADAQLDPMNRPGALIVSNTVFGSEYYAGDSTIGEKSYHFVDWGMFRENVCDNILLRGKEMTGYAKLCATNWPRHTVVTVTADGEEKAPVGGMYWAVSNSASVKAVFAPESGYKLLDGATPVASKEVALALDARGEWFAAEASDLSSLYIQRTSFEATKYSVREGGAVKVCVLGGSQTEAVQATVTYQKNTGSYSAAYYGGKKVSFPLTLSWAKGDTAAKEILFQTTATSRMEPDRFFTLQLGSAVGEAVGEGGEVCTVAIEDSEEVVASDYVRALAWPAHGGTVSGGGKLANAKSYRTLSASAKNGSAFVGWFRAKADNAEVIDLDSPVEPYSARNPKQIRVGYGTDNAAGTYFAYFTNVLEVAAVVEPVPFDGDGRTAAGVEGVAAWDACGTYTTMVGVKFALPVAFKDASGKGRLSVTKLPSGLSFNAKAGRVEGVPKKAGTYAAKFVASNAAGKHTVTYTFDVAEIPPVAVGTFAGVVTDDENRTGVGAVQFTAGKTGSLSAKVIRRLSGTRSFSVKGYDYLTADALGIAMTNSNGECFEATLLLTDNWYGTSVAGVAFGGTKKGSLGYNGETNGVFAAKRNAFSSADKSAEEYQAAQQILAAFEGTYDETLYATNAAGEIASEVGTVQYRVKSQGSVYMAAKLAATSDGTKKVSAKTISGTVTAGFTYDDGTDRAGCAAALRSGSCLWSSDVQFGYSTRAVRGSARYIRTNAEDKTSVVDVDEAVGVPAQ